MNGLVLAGGKSTRMGHDKASINWHGKEQQYHIADLLKDFCTSVFISCRTPQPTIEQNGYASLPDSITGLGPYGAILSAFEKDSTCAWLVVACDLPMITHSTLNFLVKNRKPEYIATTFQSPFDSLPEPLITIWEPGSYPVLKSFLSKGISCPRKALIHSIANIIKAEDPNSLMNVNTPEEALKASEILQLNKK